VQRSRSARCCRLTRLVPRQQLIDRSSTLQSLVSSSAGPYPPLHLSSPHVAHIVQAILQKSDSHLGGGSKPADSCGNMSRLKKAPHGYPERETTSIHGYSRSLPSPLWANEMSMKGNGMLAGGRARCVATFITLIQPRLTFLSFPRVLITPSPQVGLT